MKHIIQVEISNSPLIILELDDTNSPKTVNDFIEKLPFSVDLNVWGDLRHSILKLFPDFKVSNYTTRRKCKVIGSTK